MTSTFEAPHPAAVVSLLPLLRTEAGVRTVLYRDVPFAVVQGESAGEARERAKRLLFCSCLNALDERQIEVRDAEDEEFERWAKFRRDHVFECPTSLLGIPPLVPPTRRGERRRRSRRFLRQLAVFGAVLLLPILAAAGGIYAGFTVPADKYGGPVDARVASAGTITVGSQSGQPGQGEAAAGDRTRSGARRPSAPTPMGSAAAEIVERFTNRQFAANSETFGLGRQSTLAAQGSQRTGGGTQSSGENGEGGSPIGVNSGGTTAGGSDGQGTGGAPSLMQMAMTSVPGTSTSPTNSDVAPGETGTSTGTPGTPGNPSPTQPNPRRTTPGTEEGTKPGEPPCKDEAKQTTPGTDEAKQTTPCNDEAKQTTSGTDETKQTTPGTDDAKQTTPGTDEPGTPPTKTTETKPTTPEDTTMPDETTPTNSPGDQTTTVVAIPEPGSLALFGVSLAALALARRRRAQSPR